MCGFMKLLSEPGVDLAEVRPMCKDPTSKASPFWHHLPLAMGDSAVPFTNNAIPAKLVRLGIVNGMATCTKLANACMLMH